MSGSNSSINIYLNNTTDQKIESNVIFQILSYIPILIILIGVTGNLGSFYIFRFEKELNTMSNLVYLSYCCITDTLSLFTWNLNHFLGPNFNLSMETFNIHTCRLFEFLQYFSLQASAILLAGACIDSYFSVISIPGSFISRLPFGTAKSGFVVSSIIIMIIFLLNSFMLFTDRLVTYKNETISYNNSINYVLVPDKYDCYVLPNGYNIYPDYETIHIFIYPTFAVIIMFIFNSLLVAKVYSIKKNKLKNQSKKAQQAFNKTINLTISTLFITLVFICMCLPGTLAYKYFGDFFFSSSELKEIIYLIDSLSFLNRSSIFINCMISNIKFRRIVLKKLNKIIHFRKETIDNERSLVTSIQ